MVEKINQPVDVLASFGTRKNGAVRVTPHAIRWQKTLYKIEQFGLYHPERRGQKRVHIFSFSSGATTFRVELDPDSLEWTLAEVFYGN